jgi:hypothetical protein
VSSSVKVPGFVLVDTRIHDNDEDDDETFGELLDAAEEQKVVVVIHNNPHVCKSNATSTATMGAQLFVGIGWRRMCKGR